MATIPTILGVNICIARYDGAGSCGLNTAGPLLGCRSMEAGESAMEDTVDKGCNRDQFAS